MKPTRTNQELQPLEPDPYGTETPNYMILNEAHRAKQAQASQKTRAKFRQANGTSQPDASNKTPSGA